jgi:hypothetical protein
MAAEKLDMNLTQRRMVQQFEESFKKWNVEFDKICGCSIPVECDWNTFFFGTQQMNQETITKCWQEFYFDSLSAAFKLICADPMGKAAVKESVKKITVTGIDSQEYKSSTFENGEFHVKHSPSSYGESVKERGVRWQKLIEAAL